jgi:hypothetical protein
MTTTTARACVEQARFDRERLVDAPESVHDDGRGE